MTKKVSSIDLTDSFEKIPVKIHPDLKQGSLAVAREIAALIRDKQKKKLPCVLGLATGSTPKTLYAELVRMHKEEKLSFKNVVTFNLDEYYPIDNDALQSYNRFMRANLFDHVDINPKNIHIPKGETKKEDIKSHCNQYEKMIEDAGGIDLQILGIGNNGHIGFNEPGSSIHSRTRLITLDTSTRLANSYEFANISEVPQAGHYHGNQQHSEIKKNHPDGLGPGKSADHKKSGRGRSDGPGACLFIAKPR